MHAFDTCPAEQLYTVGDTIELVEYHTADSGLDNQLGTFDTRGGCDIERGAVAGIVAPGDLCDGVGLGMQDVRLGDAVLVLAYVLETGGGAVVTVGNNHLILDDYGPDLAALTIRILGPNSGHAQIALVEQFLFVMQCIHL